MAAGKSKKRPEKQDKPPEKKGPGGVRIKDEKREEGFRGIVRIAGKDVRGHIPLQRALGYVRGIGPTLQQAIATTIHRELDIEPSMPVGKLKEEQVEKIDQVLFNISNHGIPSYLFNRQHDVVAGDSKHLIMNDLLFSWKQDIEREKKLYTWKGYRHAYGQKVRGQRTRNTGRTGMAVGVLRKAVLAAQKAAAAPEGRAPKPGEEAKPAGGAAPKVEAKPAAKGEPKAAPKPAAKKTEAKG